jgi:hypothetical protein
MSFRPTIAVFVEGRTADFGYYRNWDEESLFFEALTIALLYSDCGSIEEYRERKFGAQKVFYCLSPEEFENTDENLAFLLSCSEFPIAVDLTAGCIYVSETPLSAEELKALPSALDPEERRKRLNARVSAPHVCEEHELEVPPEALFALEELAGARNIGTINSQTDFGTILERFRIPFGELDRETVLDLLRDWEDAPCRLSRETYTALMGLSGDGA